MGLFTAAYNQTTKRVQASSEHLRAAIANSQAELPALEQAAADAAVAFASEKALNYEQRRGHAHDTDLAALRAANADALMTLRGRQDEIAALERALPVAIERERRAEAHEAAKAENIRRGARKQKLDKLGPAFIREAMAIATNLENLNNRRTGLIKLANELGISIGDRYGSEYGLDWAIDKNVENIRRGLGLNDIYHGDLERFVTAELQKAKDKLAAEPPRTVEDELAEMDWTPRQRPTERESSTFNPVPLIAPRYRPSDELPEGYERHSFMSEGAPPPAVGSDPVAPAARPVNKIWSEPETTFGPDGTPMSFPPSFPAASDSAALEPLPSPLAAPNGESHSDAPDAPLALPASPEQPALADEEWTAA